jgi:hypothetical protein
VTVTVSSAKQGHLAVVEGAVEAAPVTVTV